MGNRAEEEMVVIFEELNELAQARKAIAKVDFLEEKVYAFKKTFFVDAPPYGARLLYDEEESMSKRYGIMIMIEDGGFITLWSDGSWSFKIGTREYKFPKEGVE